MQILRGHKAAVRVLAFEPDGKLLASGGTDDTLRLRQFPEGVEWDRLEAPACMPCLVFSPDGRWLAAPTTPAAVWVWEVANPSERRVLPVPGTEGEAHYADTVTFSPDGQRLLLSGLGGGRYRGAGVERVRVPFRSWRVGSWEAERARDVGLPSNVGWGRPWALSPGGAVLAMTDFRSHVLFWDTASGQALFQVSGGSGSAPAGMASAPTAGASPPPGCGSSCPSSRARSNGGRGPPPRRWGCRGAAAPTSCSAAPAPTTAPAAGS